MLVYDSSATGCSTPSTPSSAQEAFVPTSEAGYVTAKGKSRTSSRKPSRKSTHESPHKLPQKSPRKVSRKSTDEHDALSYLCCFLLGITIFFMMNGLTCTPDEKLEWELRSCKSNVEILENDNKYWTNSTDFWKDMYEKEVQRSEAQRADDELEKLLQGPAWKCGTNYAIMPSLTSLPGRLVKGLVRFERLVGLR